MLFRKSPISSNPSAGYFYTVHMDVMFAVPTSGTPNAALNWSFSFTPRRKHWIKYQLTLPVFSICLNTHMESFLSQTRCSVKIKTIEHEAAILNATADTSIVRQITVLLQWIFVDWKKTLKKTPFSYRCW